jgi:HlyD family secretion protein
VWKLLPDKSLEPVKIRTGITDFTFTEVKSGDLKDGDALVTGSTGGRAAASGLPGTGRGGRPPGR